MLPDLSEILLYTGEFPMKLIIWSLFIGICIAVIISFVVKVKFGAFMQALLSMNANSPDSAVTLSETGLSKSIFVRIGLRLHSNYKNLMVAITDDGRFYSNNIYTLTPPMFKEFVFQHRKHKTKIKDKEPSAQESESPDSASPEQESAISRRLRVEQEKESALQKESISTTQTDSEEWETYIKMVENIPKQRVNFNIHTARYYIPPELHDRTASIYLTKPTAFILVIAGLLVLAAIAPSAERIIQLLTDFLKEFINGLNGSNTL